MTNKFIFIYKDNRNKPSYIDKVFFVCDDKKYRCDDEVEITDYYLLYNLEE